MMKSTSLEIFDSSFEGIRSYSNPVIKVENITDISLTKTAFINCSSDAKNEDTIIKLSANMVNILDLHTMDNTCVTCRYGFMRIYSIILNIVNSNFFRNRAFLGGALFL